MSKNKEIFLMETQKTVSINRVFDLPIHTMWKAWADPDEFKKWWGPKDFTCPTCTIDFKIGGENLSCMKGPDGKEYWSIGVYKEIIPLKKIVYKDSFADFKGNEVPPSFYGMPGEWSEIMVTVALKDQDGKTQLTLKQTGIPEEMYEDCLKGWQSSFDKLQENLV